MVFAHKILSLLGKCANAHTPILFSFVLSTFFLLFSLVFPSFSLISKIHSLNSDFMLITIIISVVFYIICLVSILVLCKMAILSCFDQLLVISRITNSMVAVSLSLSESLSESHKFNSHT